jgi:hypothetical protein
MLRSSTAGRFVVAVFLVLVAGCRAPGDLPAYARDRDTDLPDGMREGIENRFTHQNEQEAPQNKTPIIDYRPLFPREAVPEPYANGVYAYAGCVSDGTHVTVAAHHAAPSECEKIVLTSYYTHDGDLEEWGVPFAWATTDTNILDIGCLAGPNDNFCWPIGLQDAFDTADTLPPEAEIIACAVNTCPDPAPEDCLPMICTGFTVEVAVNVEGPWLLMDQMMENGLPVNLVQDGKSFADPILHLDDGKVDGTTVNFELGDYAYSGVIASDRLSMQGLVFDLIVDSPAGTWSATRLAPAP